VAEIIMFPDIEDIAAAELEIALADYDREVPVSVTVPNPRPPEFVTVQRKGGLKRDLVTDSASLAFECWAMTGASAASLAALVRAIVHSWRGTTLIGGTIVYHISEFAGPAYLPDPVSKQARYTFTAALDVRGATLRSGGIS
jgi:hypothetical protein